MKRKELELYLQSLRNWLLDNGFEKDINLFVLESYNKSFIFNKTLEISISFGNQHVYIRENLDLDLVCIYNSDVNGNLTVEYLEQLIKVIYWKNEK